MKEYLLMEGLLMKNFLYFVSAMLLLAILRMPYGFYQVLRLLVVSGCLTIAYTEFKKDGWNNWVSVAIVGFIMMNPIFPVRLSKELWHIIDILMAILIAVYAFRIQVEK